MKTRLLELKLKRAKELVIVTINVDNFNYRELNILVNFLLFCVKIIIFNRFFLSTLYDSLKKYIKKYYIIVVMRQDLR